MAERDEFVVRMNEYKVFNENPEKKASEQDDFIKPMTGLVKQLERNASTSQDEIHWLQKTSEQVIGSYAEDKIVVKRRIRKVAKNVSTPFVAMVMCTSQAILKCRMQKISELEYFGEHLCWNWAGLLERSSTDGI